MMKMNQKTRGLCCRTVLVSAIGLLPMCTESKTADETEEQCTSENIPTDSGESPTDGTDVSTESIEDTESESAGENPSSLDKWPGPGCGGEPGAAGELTLSFGDETTPYYVILPDDYDKDRPTPVVYVFHGYGRTHTEMRVTDSGSLDETLSSWAIVVYPKSIGEGWDSTLERNAGLEMFEALHRKITSDYCVDSDRVFATGLSSGGYFSNTLACRYGDLLRGIAPVSGAAEEQGECVGDVAAMVINGMRDSVVPTALGWEARDYYVRENACSDETSEGAAPECVVYEGCDPNYPVQWCTHDESTYEDTNHGWPSFASGAIDLFFQSLPDPFPSASGTDLIEEPSDLDNGWSVSASGADAEGEMRGGQICVDITSPGTDDWDIQLLSPLFEMKDERTYLLDFKAWSDLPAELRVRVGQSDSPYKEFWTGRMDLGLPERFVRTFTMSELDEPSANLSFQLGGALAGQTPLTVCIFDIVFSEETL